MIKYKLICKACNLSFDSWFSCSQEYERLKKKNFLSCFECNSKKIEKTLMAPKLISDSKIQNTEQLSLKLKKINEFQKFIKKNFNYVGKNFAYEARSIYYNNKKNKRGIYGSASVDEIKELKEEGINTKEITWIENKKN
jgi:hypothetical protein